MCKAGELKIVIIKIETTCTLSSIQMTPLRQGSSTKAAFDLPFICIFIRRIKAGTNSSHIWALITFNSRDSCRHDRCRKGGGGRPRHRKALLGFDRGRLRETKLGHLHFHVCEGEGVVAVVLVVFISAVIKRLLGLWRWCRRCSLCRNNTERSTLES